MRQGSWPVTPLVRPYPATVEPADAALRTRLETLTGNELR